MMVTTIVSKNYIIFRDKFNQKCKGFICQKVQTFGEKI